MIPSRYDARTSSAERRVFDLLKNDPATEDWIVLHSLGLARRGEKPYGEIDFVLLVPGGGIVCLEVKGGRVSCKDGEWYTQDRFGARERLRRSPFLQARQGMFALRDAVIKRFGKTDAAARALFGYAVVFTDTEVPPQTPEFEPYEAVDRQDLREPVSRSIWSLLRQLQKKVSPRSGTEPVSAPTLTRLRDYLRPDFERIVSRSASIAASEERLVALTREQYSFLDLTERNDRCLLEGAAGTGKTLLALECARRSTETHRKTGLFCFNRLLGTWLSKEVRNRGFNHVISGNYHHCLHELIAASTYCEEFQRQQRVSQGEQLFSEVYPFFAELALEENTDQLDMLIVDEAQDLIREDVLNVFNVWLRGGLAGGNWIMVGDFTRQAIFGGPNQASGRKSITTLLGRYCEHYVEAGLKINCRNTRQIAEQTALLSGFSAFPYKVSDIEGLPVDYRFWRDADHETEQFRTLIRELMNEKVSPRDIVILSATKPRRALQQAFADVATVHLSGENANDHFFTIQSFKGMESPVVIVCGIEDIGDDNPQSLLYVGMSRARSLLILLLQESVRESIGTLVRSSLSRGLT